MLRVNEMEDGVPCRHSTTHYVKVREKHKRGTSTVLVKVCNTCGKEVGAWSQGFDGSLLQHPDKIERK